MRSKNISFKKTIRILMTILLSLIIPCSIYGQSKTIERKPVKKTQIDKRNHFQRDNNKARSKDMLRTKSIQQQVENYLTQEFDSSVANNSSTAVSTEAPSTEAILIIENIIKNMVKVEGGTFMMGKKGKVEKRDLNNRAYAERPIHQVTLSDFSIGRYEVTQKEWSLIMGYNPSDVKGENLPVNNVSWDGCQDFIKRLNTITGRHFRLPTEAEWEYAARGGQYSH